MTKDENDFVYTYNYGDIEITEMWIHQNDSSYEFIVGIYENEHWEEAYLNTYFYKKPLPLSIDIERIESQK